MEDWVHVNETDSHEGGGDFLIRTLVYLQSGAMSGLNDCLHPSRHPSQQPHAPDSRPPHPVHVQADAGAHQSTQRPRKRVERG